MGTTFRVHLPFGHEHLTHGQVANGCAAAPLVVQGSAVAYVQEALGWMPGHEQLRSQIAGSVAGDQDDEPDIAVAAPSRSYFSWTTTPTCASMSAPCWPGASRLLLHGNGKLALEEIERRPPALVLTDVMMPEMDGFALLSALRQNPATATIPVIMLSARAGEEARIEGVEAGADDYLTKPFTARELIARVDAQLKMARMRQRGGRTKSRADHGDQPRPPVCRRSAGARPRRLLHHWIATTASPT